MFRSTSSVFCSYFDRVSMKRTPPWRWKPPQCHNSRPLRRYAVLMILSMLLNSSHPKGRCSTATPFPHPLKLRVQPGLDLEAGSSATSRPMPLSAQPLLHETYTCMLRRNQVISREVLTKRHNVLDSMGKTKVECQMFRRVTSWMLMDSSIH